MSVLVCFNFPFFVVKGIRGSNKITNLWPLARNAEPWNAYVKDVFERKLHTMICTGGLSLSEVQAALAKNWTAAYWRWIGE